MAGICQGFGLVLSKMGLQHYDMALTALNISQDAVFEGALLPLPVSICVPFAATTIRAYIGLAGFFLSLMLFSKDGLAKLRSAIRDRKAMGCVFASTIFGPFIGVSASLFATMYTSAGIAQTIFALTPILIIAPAAILFHQKVTVREVIGAVISVVGVCLFFV
jgi:drug/metabolite transporter (DMT)-like permease